MEEKKAFIAMSGGVDSSVAAYLMKRDGWDCLGGTMYLLGRCPGCSGLTPDSCRDARAVADRMGMEHVVLDYSDFFAQTVMTPFVESYEGGTTPNPCFLCNRRLKFGILLEAGLERGCEVIVTGHYARIGFNDTTGRWELRKAVHLNKDQSYFLSGLSQEQLSRIRFPLGEFTKDQVREIADAQGFVTAHKKDSQDVCFIPDGDYRRFMERYTGKTYPAGDFLDLDGHVIGQHTGAVGYTLGQRKGLGLAMGTPVYVCGKDMSANTVTVGPEGALFRRSLTAQGLNWISIDPPASPIRVLAKARYRMTEQPATVYPLPDGSVRVVFDEPQRALTPGQAVAFYEGDRVVGSGTIVNVME